MWAGRQSSISRSEVTESVEYVDEAEGVEETGMMGDDGQTRGAVVVQKPPTEVAANKEGTFTWAFALGVEMVEVGVVWGAGKRRKPGRWEQRGGERGMG